MDSVTSYEWPGLLAVSGMLATEECELLFKVVRNTADSGSVMPVPRIGIMTPGICYGPLKALGLLRQVNYPLGCAGQSDAFQERTDLLVDRALPSTAPGFLCEPVRKRMGLFSLPLEPGGMEYGAFLDLPLPENADVSGMVTISQPPVEEQGEDWFTGVVPYPGGGLMDAAVRLRLDAPVMKIAAAAGASGGERNPPGFFGSFRLGGEGEHWSAAVLLAGASDAYRSPAGDEASASVAFSGFVDVIQGGTELRASSAAAILRPDVAPSLLVPTWEKVLVSIRQELPCGPSGPVIAGSIEGRKSLRYESTGKRSESAQCSMEASCAAKGLEAVVGLECSTADGLGCFTSLTATVPTGLDLGVEARLAGLAEQRIEASAIGSLGFKGGQSAFSLKAGLRDCPWSLQGRELADHFMLEASWTASTRILSLTDR